MTVDPLLIRLTASVTVITLDRFNVT